MPADFLTVLTELIPTPLETPMIQLHRIGHDHVVFHLNPDLILSVEAHPDTVVTLTTGDRFLVAETAAEVCDAVDSWRISLLSGALRPKRPVSESQVARSYVDLTERLKTTSEDAWRPTTDSS
jgi:flagellar protein FlbD